MNFRQATAADVNRMIDIRTSANENVLSDPSQATTKAYLDYLSHQGRGWVCEVDEQVVGFCIADKVNHRIWALFIEPDYESMGIGKQLLQLAVNYLFNIGANEITLCTQADTHADRFYQSLGWQRGELTDNEQVSFTLTPL